LFERIVSINKLETGGVGREELRVSYDRCLGGNSTSFRYKASSGAAAALWGEFGNVVDRFKSGEVVCQGVGGSRCEIK